MKKALSIFLVSLFVLSMSIISFAAPICDACNEGRIVGYTVKKDYIFDAPHTYYLITSGKCEKCGESYNTISGPYHD